MKRKPTAIRKKDPARVLLTELLPYELPIFFSNYSLYKFRVKVPAKTPVVIRKILGIIETFKYTIPFNYVIERGDGRHRTLSIMHPAVQLKFVEFYATWDAYIINQCTKSDFSLRRPVQIGSVYFESELQDEEPQLGDDAGDLAPSFAKEQRTNASSYFYYASYNQIWKFFDSTEFRRMEQNHRNLLRLDVSRCFNSIYTHSISWAVRDKVFAKKNKDEVSFDNSFDKLMQRANWNETNGIIVGPEVSRLFAEVILQQIDDDIKTKLVHEGIYPNKVSIKRYVDDYMVFFTSEDVAKKTRKVIDIALDKYKLSINDSKTETISSPLISNLSIARDSIRDLFRDRVVHVFEWETADTNTPCNTPRTPTERSADNLIRALKGVIKVHGATYSTISPYALGIVSKVLHRALKRLTKIEIQLQDPHRIHRTLSYLLEISFFLYRMDVRANTTYRVASILIAASNVADKFGSIGKMIRQEVIDHGVSVLKQAEQASIGDCEIASLLACLFYIGGNDAIPESDVINVLRLNDESTVGYFQIVTALFCAQDKTNYDALRARACALAVRLVKSRGVDAHIDTESVLLFFDILSCPFADSETKEAVIDAIAASLGCKKFPDSDVNLLKKFVSSHISFTEWDASNELPALLHRKELKPAYD